MAPEEWQIIRFTLGVSVLSTLMILPFGTALAWLLARPKWPGKTLVETLVALPLVMPPVATGLILLKLLGRRGAVGSFVEKTFGLEIVFTWRAVVIAIGIMSFPLLVRAARVAFEEVKQRIALARALLSQPRLLLLDEPPASLDDALKAKSLALLRRVRAEFAVPILYVSHSAEEITALCDKVLVLQSGRMIRHGTPSEIFTARNIPILELK